MSITNHVRCWLFAVAHGWSSWANGLSMIRRRPDPVRPDRAGIVSRTPCLPLGGIVFTEMGFVAPGWEALRWNAALGIPKHGWQHKAAQKADDSSSPGVRVLCCDHGGPMSGLPFTCCPTSFHSRFEAQLFRVLFLHRLCVAVILTCARTWVCRLVCICQRCSS